MVSLYEKYYGGLPTSSQEIAPEAEVEANGKECSNLIVLLSELYNFQVISSVLVFDIIRRLLTGDLTEFGVELLLKIVRSACACILFIQFIQRGTTSFRLRPATSSG